MIFQVVLLLTLVLLAVSPLYALMNNSTSARNELDEICCPVIILNRSKTIGMLWDPSGSPQNITYLYQSTRYKQFLEETLCQFPDTNVPEIIKSNDSRCDGQCQQLHGNQLMITLQHSPISFVLALIDVKIGCTFIPNN